RISLTSAVTEALHRGLHTTEQDALAVFRTVQAVLRAIVRGVFGFFIVVMLSAYFLLTSKRIFAFFRSLVGPNSGRNFDGLLHRIDEGLCGVIRGQLLICLINGAFSGIGFYVLDIKYWPILTLIAAVLSIIPIFGVILSSVPAVVLGLQDGIATGVLVL